MSRACSVEIGYGPGGGALLFCALLGKRTRHDEDPTLVAGERKESYTRPA
ncbi:MAG: hypothetical protein HY900_25605 [Deltaproteobacteria bacterium]|nr:hypothetical protein [Deltaproteobacteria bacterium]